MLSAIVDKLFGGNVKSAIALSLYTLIWLVTATLSWILRSVADTALPDRYLVRLPDCGGRDACLGSQAVLRIALGNTLFFALMALTTFGVNRSSSPRFRWHTGGWPVKLLLWFLLLLTMFYVPQRTVTGFASASRYLSAFWLILQIITLLDSIYSLNRFLLNADMVEWIRAGCLISFSAIGYAAGVALVIASWALYSLRASCSATIAIGILTLLGCLLYTIASLVPRRYDDAGLMTAGFVFAYCGLLTVSATASGASDACRRYPSTVTTTSTEPTWIVALSFALVLLAIAYSALLTSYQQLPIARGLQMLFGFHPEDLVKDPGHADPHGQEDRPLPYRPDVMYLVYGLASLYLGMVLTSWGQRGQVGTYQADVGRTSMWIKAATSWTVALLYTWTTLAPRWLWGKRGGGGGAAYRSSDVQMTPFGPVNVRNV